MIRRLAQLIFGLVLYGFAAALMVRANLGLSPWHIFHQGVARVTGISFGMVVNLTGAALLLAWIPMRQRIGVGTILNIVTIGSAADFSLRLIPPVESLVVRWLLLAAAIGLTGIACGIYIGAGLEPGPRDGLMTGIAKRTGWSIRFTRTGVELAVLAIGVLLGGKIGIGTFVYAAFIGPVVHFAMTKFAWRPDRGTQREVKNAAVRPPSGATIRASRVSALREWRTSRWRGPGKDRI